MDQDAYHKTYREVNDRPCHYEKCILANQCNCPHAERFYLAERVGVHCTSGQGQRRCADFLQYLRSHARFALKLTRDAGTLPHAKAMRLQAGGMLGLSSVLHPEQPAVVPVNDIDGLLRQAMDSFSSLERLPYQEIIKQLSSYQGRRRRRPKPG